ncbi:MAG: hypothetical protein KDC04_02020 [Saprospiraceae bacterium]|nr:hypothetical protein [Saprospiraceae bacterium]MCB9309767.1 hypothetical protein [Lewinellaceae bacterium]
MAKKELNQRILITISLLGIHFLVSYLRIIAVEKHWSEFIKFIFGILPSFYSVIGLTVAFNIFENKRQLKMPFIVGLASLIYEVTGDFGRKQGRGSTVDLMDIAAIILGIFVSYLIERYYFAKKFKTEIEAKE